MVARCLMVFVLLCGPLHAALGRSSDDKPESPPVTRPESAPTRDVGKHRAAAASIPRLAEEMRPEPGYAFMTSDIEQCSIVKYGADGKPFWSYEKQVRPIDAWAMPDGSVLIAYLPSDLTSGKGGVRRVDADKKTVFDIQFDDEIMSVQPLDNGHFLMAECHKGMVTEMDADGNRFGAFSVATRPCGHKTVRQIRLTEKGTVVAAECYSHKLREYSRKGELLREISLRYVYYPEIQKNGNILAACWNFPEAQIVELDPEGKVVWNVKASELPEVMRVTHLAGVARLPNGNTLVGASCKPGNQRGKTEHEPRVMLFEITPDKQIVWQMMDPDGSTWLSTVKLLAD